MKTKNDDYLFDLPYSLMDYIVNFPDKFVSVQRTNELLNSRLDNHIYNTKYMNFDEEDSRILGELFSTFIKEYGSMQGESKICVGGCTSIQLWIYNNKNVWGYNIIEEIGYNSKEVFNKFLLKSRLFQILNHEDGVSGIGLGFLKSWIITVILDNAEKFLKNVTERDKEILKKLYDMSPYYRKIEKEIQFQYSVRIKGNANKLKDANDWTVLNTTKDERHIAAATRTGQLFRFKNYEKFVEFKLKFQSDIEQNLES